MNSPPDQLSILYADMCGSVSLYERLGDAEGHRLARQCMAVLSDITRRLGGTLIRTQGDGVMSTFPDPVVACRAARTMQEAHRSGLVRIKVGFNHGAVIHGGNDVYGDAVNLAARVMGLARPGEILTTGYTVALLAPEQQLGARLLDRVPLKGKSDPVVIYALVDEADEQATVIDGQWAGRRAPPTPALLVLVHRDLSFDLQSPAPPLFIGRSPQCQLTVESDFASRRHAVIESHRDHFLLTDQSTNGTYLTTRDGEQLFLKRESARLVGSGALSLGIRPREDDENLIRFSCRLA